jgi:hypothetical protein
MADETTATQGAALAHRRAHVIGADLALALAVIATLLTASVATVLRYTADFLQADGVEQSVMSIQDVDLFFWGQNRFAAFVSLLASPIADPDANLFACLLINAISFHVLLLVLAWMGARVVTGTREHWATAVLFLSFVAAAHLLIAPAKMHIMALESQPYSMSWALTLGAFLLWKRREAWAFALSALMVGAAMGLNQSTVLIAAFLSVVEIARRRQWVRWPVFGAIWVAWFGVWAVLSARYGGVAGPIPDASQEYFAFDLTQFVSGATASLTAIVGAFRPVRLTIMLVMACAAVLALGAARRAALLSRLSLATTFSVLYWAVFTGNPWVAANGYPFRYFFPVVIFVVVAAATPIAAAVLGVARLEITLATRAHLWPGRETKAAHRISVALVAAASAAAMAGPLVSPSHSAVLEQTQATGRYAVDKDITFLAGYYWDMWPVQFHVLKAGRTAGYTTGFKSGGDPEAYRRAFERELAETDGPPRAMCVNQDIAVCETDLSYWTAPGWVPTSETCPIPGDSPQLGSPPVRSCRVMVFDGARGGGVA